jgi:CHAD domain-containing protein
MSRLPEIKTGDFLYHYYQKRIASFLINIYTAGISAAENDVHKARVDLKKLFALFGFFKLIGIDLSKNGDPQKIFHKVYISAGKIREIQMNLLYIENLEKNDPALAQFYQYLKNNSKKRTKQFIQAIIRFDEKRLDVVRRSIKKSCRNIEIERVIQKCNHFFMIHSEKIKKYRSETTEIENVHRIRIEMKKISEVASLLKLLCFDDFVVKLISAVTQSEIIIGEWHDRVIFQDSVDVFIKKNERIRETLITGLRNLKNTINIEAEKLLNKSLPEVDNVVNLIDQQSTLRKA